MGHGSASRWGGGDPPLPINQTTSHWDPSAEMQNKNTTALVGKGLHCRESRLGRKRGKRKYFGNNPRRAKLEMAFYPYPNPSQQNKVFLQLGLAQHVFKIHISCHKSYGTLSPPTPLLFSLLLLFFNSPMIPHLYSRSKLPCAPGNFPPTVRSSCIQEGSAGWALDSGGRTQPAG